jgi:hypothetical protein
MGAGGRWHYIAQRFDGTSGGLGDFLDFDVPLQGVNIEDVLSGHNGLSGTINPEYPRLKGADGMPILEEGGCAIWAEDPSGQIRGGGILTHSAFDDESGSWQIECTDLTGTSEGLPFDEGVWFVNVDPLDLFRYIWTHIQSHQNHNLGISIDPTTSPVRLGTDLVQHQEFDLEPDVSADLDPQPPPTAPPRYATNTLWREAAVKAMKATGWKADVVDDALKKWLSKDELVEAKKWEPLTDKERTIRDRSIDKVGWPPDPPNPGHRTTLVVNMRPQVNPPTGGEEIPDADPTETEATYQYDAYKLNWYDTLDLGSSINDLAANTPFDWHMVHWWEGEEIRHHIRLGHPRIGRRREELRFVIGENIHTPPGIERDGTEYANEVLFLGAGEGATMIRARAFRRDDRRIRKVAVVSDPTVKDQSVAQKFAEIELAKRFNIENITEVMVSNHAHAPIGSVDLGDEILVQGDLGWIDLETWCRVIGRTMAPDDSDMQVLTLLRSDRIA